MKGILSFQSDPLVAAIVSILESLFGIQLKVDDKRIEDASIVDESGKILAVVEIKGLKGDVKREHINQLDNHRERLELDQSVPGIAENRLLDSQRVPEQLFVTKR
jgi:CheY-specific phosphatase CheX